MCAGLCSATHLSSNALCDLAPSLPLLSLPH
jgi:hypothetical protein